MNDCDRSEKTLKVCILVSILSKSLELFSKSRFRRNFYLMQSFVAVKLFRRKASQSFFFLSELQIVLYLEIQKLELHDLKSCLQDFFLVKGPRLAIKKLKETGKFYFIKGSFVLSENFRVQTYTKFYTFSSYLLFFSSYFRNMHFTELYGNHYTFKYTAIAEFPFHPADLEA